MHENKRLTPAPKGKSKKPRVSNQVKLDAKNPIPFDFTGTSFSYLHNSPYLPFLPPNDNYGQMLLEARLLSVTNNACIGTKKDYCAGQGFEDAEGNPFDKPIIDWLSCLNRRNESATACSRDIFEDFFTYGNCPVEVVRFSAMGKKYLYVYPHSFLEWRLGKPDKNDICTYAVQSKLFLRQNAISADAIKEAKKLPIYNPLNTDKQNWQADEKDKTVQRTLIWYKNRVTGFPYYGLPSNVASMIYQLLEYNGARYNLDNFDNNMVVASILALKGNLSTEEANKIAKQIITQHTGNGKRGRTVVVASEEGIDGSDFHKLDTKTDGSYTEADDKWTQKIILANEWDAILAGIISPSTLGKGANFITKILEIKLNSVIKPAQTKLLEAVWNDVFKMAEDWMGLKFSNYKIQYKNAVDISGLTDVDITPAVQVNEVRKAKGLTEDKAMKGVYMKSKSDSTQNKGGEDVPV